MQSVPEVLAVVATSESRLQTAAVPAADDATTAAARTVPAELAEPAEPAAVPPIAAAEPEMIDVWRPGRAEGRPRPPRKHRDRDRHFGRRTGADSVAPAPTPDAATAASAATADGTPAAEPSAPNESGRPERHSRHRRRQGSEQRRGGEERRGGDPRFDRPRRDRDRPPNAVRHERQPDRREKAPDPNSPFAKLAALKAQLEAEAKERR